MASQQWLDGITIASVKEVAPLNKGMTDIPQDFLTKIEFLPDGTATNDQKVWLKAWGDFASKQVLSGKIKLYEIEGFNEETGEVPNEFIKNLYFKERRLH